MGNYKITRWEQVWVKYSYYVNAPNLETAKNKLKNGEYYDSQREEDTEQDVHCKIDEPNVKEL